MQRMGIDFGTKKVGIALSDESGVMAFPHSVMPNDEKLLSNIEALIANRSVAEVVIGYSLNNAGEPNPVHALVEEFMMNLTLATGVPIHLEPEQYSSQQAAQITGKNSQTDAAAAALILDSFITKQNT